MTITFLKIFQSGFRPLHSVEKALVKLSILIILDLSSAFETVDHNIIISRLKHSVGISEVALNWFISYLSNRTFSVMLGDASWLSRMYPLDIFCIAMILFFYVDADNAQLNVLLKPGSTIFHIFCPVWTES